MASRDFNDLKPHIYEKAVRLIQECREAKLEILIYCTLRPLDEQARLYRQGRTLKQIKAKAEELKIKWGRPDLGKLLMDVGPQQGKLATYAGPGQSMHNYGLAIDGVPLRGGKPVWNASKPDELKLWQLYGRLGDKVGFEWAGKWTKFRELPHLQQPGAVWQELIRR